MKQLKPTATALSNLYLFIYHCIAYACAYLALPSTLSGGDATSFMAHRAKLRPLPPLGRGVLCL